MAGATVLPQRRIYNTINEPIHLLVNTYANNNIIDYLRGISYNLA